MVLAHKKTPLHISETAHNHMKHRGYTMENTSYTTYASALLASMIMTAAGIFTESAFLVVFAFILFRIMLFINVYTAVKNLILKIRR